MIVAAAARDALPSTLGPFGAEHRLQQDPEGALARSGPGSSFQPAIPLNPGLDFHHLGERQEIGRRRQLVRAVCVLGPGEHRRLHGDRIGIRIPDPDDGGFLGGVRWT